jgi:hypothetical protein
MIELWSIDFILLQQLDKNQIVLENDKAYLLFL